MYGGIRKPNIRQELDRNQWAELQATEFEFEVTGLGEALTDPIYFGRAYDRPPLLNFSVVADANSGPEVKAFTYPTSTITAALDDLHWDGKILDPQFEQQMNFGNGYIPDFSDWFRGFQTFQVLHQNATGYDVYAANDPDWWTEQNWDTPGVANMWFQTRGEYAGQPRWAISSDVRLSKSPRPSDYSLKFTFDSVGKSRIVGWVDNTYDIDQVLYGYWGIYETDSDDTLWRNGVMQYTQDANVAAIRQTSRPDGYLELVNPKNNRWALELEIYSTANAKWFVEMLFYGDREFEAVPSPVGGPTNYSPSHIITSDNFESDLAQGWNTVRFDFPLPSWLIPNVPDQGVSYDGYNTVFGNVKMYATGANGESVYLARALTWSNFTTDPTIPFMTVGVAEWLRDEQGAYVGAVLWMKTKQPGAS